MSSNATPPRPSNAADRPGAVRTPSTLAAELSKMDLPAPANLRLNTRVPTTASNANPLSPIPDSANSAIAEGDIDGPEPEAITEIRRKVRSESMSEQLSATLSKMEFPQPERIFGPNEGESTAAKEHPMGKEGVRPEDWEEVILGDGEVPESVRTGKMTHSRNASRVDGTSFFKQPTIPEASELAASLGAVAAGAAAMVTGAVASATTAAVQAVSGAAESTGGPSQAREQKITPFDVEGGVDEEGKSTGIDYNKTVKRFGASMITQELLERFERVTGHRPHPLLRRGTFFSHRDFDQILDRYEKGQSFYLYTGRGPSSDSMHMGHLIPFMFTAWLQRVFNCPLVIQITDDEKYLLERDVKKQAELQKKIKAKKNVDLLKHYHKMGQDNIRDIIACGFQLDKTFIFSNLGHLHGAFYQNVVLMAKTLTASQIKNVFGFTDSDNVGMYHFAAIQATPAFSNSFPQIFGERDDIPCLIPCAIDQDPYFLLTRDSAERLGYRKPSLLHSKFLPALQGANTKMSASKENTAIFMTDDAKKISKKIKSHAFSGGGATQEEHREKGGDPDVDVAYQYLSFFEDDDTRMDELARGYRAGTLSTSEMKQACIEKIQGVVDEFQRNREGVTDEMLAAFQDSTRKIDPRPVAREAATAAT